MGDLGNHDIKKAVEQGPSLNELFMDAVKEKEPQTLKVPGQVNQGCSAERKEKRGLEKERRARGLWVAVRDEREQGNKEK